MTASFEMAVSAHAQNTFGQKQARTTGETSGSLQVAIRCVHVNGNGYSHSHGIPMGNESCFGLPMEMGIGMGIVLMGMGIAYFIGEQ